MEINFEPDYYNKAKPMSPGSKVHSIDTSTKLLAYKFSMSEVYMLGVDFSAQNDPNVQIELLDKILLDLTRTSQTIEELKKKIIASLSIKANEDEKIDDIEDRDR